MSDRTKCNTCKHYGKELEDFPCYYCKWPFRTDNYEEREQ